MVELEKIAEPVVDKLLRADEEQLYEQLGIRAKALARDPSIAGSFDIEILYDQTEMGAKEEVLKLGRRVFHRWNVEAHKLVCGTSTQDITERNKLRDAFGLSETAVAAVLSAFLVAQLGIAPVLAAVVAAILCKRFFNPAYEEFCTAWARNLSE